MNLVYEFKCLSCQSLREGTRFFLLSHQDGVFVTRTLNNFRSIDDPIPAVLQICSDCEPILTSQDNRPLPPQYRLLLRASLPLPDDDEISSIASSEDDDDLKQVKKKVGLVLDQQVAQEHRLEERMRGIEAKLEGVALALDRQLPQAHQLDGGNESKMDSIALALDQHAAKGHRLNEQMRDLKARMDGVDAKLDLVLNLLVALHDHSPISPLRQLPHRPPGSRGKVARNDQPLADA